MCQITQEEKEKSQSVLQQFGIVLDRTPSNLVCVIPPDQVLDTGVPTSIKGNQAHSKGLSHLFQEGSNDIELNIN